VAVPGEAEARISGLPTVGGQEDADREVVPVAGTWVVDEPTAGT
jgi:hypothetical protein